MRWPLSTSIAALCALILSGCGFHLRGMDTPSVALGSMAVTAENAYGELQREVESALRQARSDVVDAAEAGHTIHLMSERTTRHPISTTSDNSVAEYELSLEVTFELIDADGTVLLAEEQVSAQRIYSFDRTNLVGSGEEEKLLTGEMRREIASSVLRRVAAVISGSGS
ncbi:MAG: hypothetical protein KDI19_00885 [Pseudomonadales bacterium]|nr:hypothetical protein [Pseudomonadales bacterium]